MQKEFIAFIKSHHVLHLATCFDNIPYIASCFYAYENDFYIASSLETKHIKQALQNPKVAFSIALQTKEVGKIQGLQATGIIQKTTNKNVYFKQFPYAKILNPSIWQIQVLYAKLTDNRLGFGKKLIFEKS